MHSSDIGETNTTIPFICPSLSPKTKYDWNYTTEAQEGLGGRAIDYPRGYVLGGSSTISKF
jgi:choline dehydrogenase-like flavoprotein